MLFAVAFVLQSAPAAAAQTPSAPPPYRSAPSTIVAEPVALLLTGFDRDHDAQITQAEMRAGLEDLRKADRAWDGAMGYLDFADWAQRWLGNPNAVPTPFDIDRDGDNRITFDELANRIGAIFDRYDTDRNGVLTRPELLTVLASPFGSDRPDGPRGERRRERR